jgi:transposase
MQTAFHTVPDSPPLDTLKVSDLLHLLEQKEHALAQKDDLLAQHEQAIADREQVIADREQIISDHEHVINDHKHIIEEQRKLLKLMEEKLRLARQKRFGASSEKLPFQGDFFDEAELEAALSDIEQQIEEQEKSKPKHRKPREGFSDKLPRIRVEFPLSEEEKTGARQTFFTKVKEELDIIRAQARVIEYWQEKAVFDEPDGSQRIEAASRPVHPLGKCIASVQLLAYLLVAKYADALPLYRLEKIFKRYGVTISRTTMANWIIGLDGVFKPLIELIRAHQVSGDYLQADETRIQVLKETGRVATSDKWMWVVRGGPPGQPAVLFDYDASRGEEVALRLFEGFRGVLQVDGYASYNRVCRENALTRIGCWDHARRKFVEASQAMPAQKKGSKVSKADVALSKIRKLYAIEKRIESLDPVQKREQRQALSLPILVEFKSWLELTSRRVVKDSETWKAIHYTLNQWETLIGYCEDGRLHISNALAENAIRPFAVGRRNWLFADTPRGARASATIYSLIETAKANDVEPYDYLLHILKHIGSADTVEKLEALLPWNMKAEDSQEG